MRHAILEEAGGASAGSRPRPRAGASRAACPSPAPPPGPRRGARPAPAPPRAAGRAGSRRRDPRAPRPTIRTPTSISGSPGAATNSFDRNGGGNVGGSHAALRARTSSVSFGNDLVQVADDPEVGVLEDRGVRVLVDRDDQGRALHADLVLDRAGDPDGDVELRGDGLAGLADLGGVRDTSRHRRPPASPRRRRRAPWRAPRRARSSPARRARGRRRRSRRRPRSTGPRLSSWACSTIRAASEKSCSLGSIFTTSALPPAVSTGSKVPERINARRGSEVQPTST